MISHSFLSSKLIFVLVFSIIFQTIGTNAQVIQTAPGTIKTIDPAEWIHYGDVVEIDVIGGYEYDWRGILNPEGFLQGFDKTPEPVFARCKSTSDLADTITAAYSKFLRNPKIEVRILDRTNRPLAYIDGAIKNRLRLRIKRTVFLNELIIIAGGFTDKTSGEITVFRPDNLSCEPSESSGPVTLKIKIADVLAGVVGANPKIVSGDIITIAEALPIYVIGGVSKPAKLSSRSEITLSHAIAAAGGVAKNGVAGLVTIYRREKSGSQVIEADLSQISSGTKVDPVLKPFDIVEVGQKGTPKRRFPPVIEELENLSRKASTVPLRVIE